MNLIEEYRSLVKGHLDSLTHQFEDELYRATNMAFSEDVKFLQIEYDSPSFSDDFSVCMFAMNKYGDLVGEVFRFLKNKAVVVPANIYTSEKYEEIDPWSTASVVFESWLMERWANAGNRNYPAYLAHHDSYFMRSLENGSEKNWDEIIEMANS